MIVETAQDELARGLYGDARQILREEKSIRGKRSSSEQLKKYVRWRPDFQPSGHVAADGFLLTHTESAASIAWS